MKKSIILQTLLFLFCLIAYNPSYAQSLFLYETFEDTIDPKISFFQTGCDLKPAGVIEASNFGSTKVFSFGKSTCHYDCYLTGVSLYEQNHMSYLRITLPDGFKLKRLTFKWIELVRNWGSLGLVLIDSISQSQDSRYIGRYPNSDNVVDESIYVWDSIYQPPINAKYIDLLVFDIADVAEIIIDDIEVYSSEPSSVEFKTNNENDIINVYPNPVDNYLNISLSLIELGYTELSLYNLIGEKIKVIYSGDLSKTKKIELRENLSELSAGPYLLVLKTPTSFESKYIIISK